MKQIIDRNSLEGLYRRFNRRDMVHPDPLEFLYGYDDPADREIVGLIASALAYGRVAQILQSVEAVLDKASSPIRFLRDNTPASIERVLAGFKHRFTTGAELARLLAGAKALIERHGSLQEAFAIKMRADDPNVLPALDSFVNELTEAGALPHLLAAPSRGSACKRLHLYLRWMVRRDEVDPGGWDRVPKFKLIVPVDTHMLRISRSLGLTRRKTADGKTALEITEAFKKYAPDDPVKYDFALTRFGIRGELSIEDLLDFD